jgi:hypothetical protein
MPGIGPVACGDAVERGPTEAAGAATGQRERQAREENTDRTPGCHVGGPPAIVGTDVRPAGVKEQ